MELGRERREQRSHVHVCDDCEKTLLRLDGNVSCCPAMSRARSGAAVGSIVTTTLTPSFPDLDPWRTSQLPPLPLNRSTTDFQTYGLSDPSRSRRSIAAPGLSARLLSSEPKHTPDHSNDTPSRQTKTTLTLWESRLICTTSIRARLSLLLRVQLNNAPTPCAPHRVGDSPSFRQIRVGWTVRSLRFHLHRFSPKRTPCLVSSSPFTRAFSHLFYINIGRR